MDPMRIALFGGTFDPIHRGHLRVARAAADAYALDRVLFAPVGHQPLKPGGASASFADRLAMVRLALEEPSSDWRADPSAKTGRPAYDSRFAASSLDAPHPDGSPNYTVDTLAAFAREYPGEELFALAGADSFLDLRRWRSPNRVLSLAEWIVVSRPDFPFGEGSLAALALTPSERSRIHLLTTVHEDISATELRRRLETGDPCTGVLPAPVAAYIVARNLYRGVEGRR
ncbi:MAG TPA: nicotinate (nicotinamide) nucleotide adenylyltransferase [Acidobacteriaceae bacterium]|nr:nicotinate (nicotinamide) nucleotide adenylyltransferase [Acidobacteriaceae bacterium]